MNDDIRILSMLLRFSQRRMVPMLDQVYAHVGAGAPVADALLSLRQGGLIYQNGPSVRLTLAGFARAVAATTRSASVHPLRQVRTSRSHAA